MKIALISPKSSFLGKNRKLAEFWNQSDYTEAYREEWSGISVALCILAALTPNVHEVEIIDENIEEINFSLKYDLVGITCMTQQATRAYQIADEWRKLSVTVIIGGIHASVLPEETKTHADSVVIGEAEDLWKEILFDVVNKNLKPYYKSAHLVDLSKLPIPRYELLKNKKYKYHWIQTTRGCPFNCIFCAASKVYGNKYRVKAIEHVIAEIEYLIDLYPDSRIIFSDDNMFVNRRYAKKLLQRITPYKIRYMAQSDISIADDEELLNLIKKSGCTFLFIGLESLSETNLEGIDRNNKKKKYFSQLPEHIKKIQSYGIGVMGAFIAGFDEDDVTVFKEITEFAIKNVLYNTQISILTPFPGTEIRKKLLSENRILNTDWEYYTVFDVNITHPKITKDQFEEGITNAYKKLNSQDFYFKKMMHFKNIHTHLANGQNI